MRSRLQKGKEAKDDTSHERAKNARMTLVNKPELPSKVLISCGSIYRAIGLATMSYSTNKMGYSAVDDIWSYLILSNNNR